MKTSAILLLASAMASSVSAGLMIGTTDLEAVLAKLNPCTVKCLSKVPSFSTTPTLSGFVTLCNDPAVTSLQTCLPANACFYDTGVTIFHFE